MAQTETATLGGGCFWCVEAVYQRVEGVLSVKPGYAGGHVINPTYKEICTGKTGHAEVAQIEFDPAQITYEQILNVFWQAHDPTTLNRQGKRRRTRTGWGKRKDTKRAIVALKDGSIDIFGGSL